VGFPQPGLINLTTGSTYSTPAVFPTNFKMNNRSGNINYIFYMRKILNPQSIVKKFYPLYGSGLKPVIGLVSKRKAPM
jgi:hypothetical protein